MAKVSKTEVDKKLRNKVFDSIGFIDNMPPIEFEFQPIKINDRQYGMLITDANGEQRYVRIPVIVAELREDMTAEELMQKEIDDYNQKQADKAEKAKKKEVKIAKDKARREAEKAKQEHKEDDPVG